MWSPSNLNECGLPPGQGRYKRFHLFFYKAKSDRFPLFFEDLHDFGQISPQTVSPQGEIGPIFVVFSQDFPILPALRPAAWRQRLRRTDAKDIRSSEVRRWLSGGSPPRTKLFMHSRRAVVGFLLPYMAQGGSVGDYGEFATSFRPSRYFLLVLWLKAPPNRAISAELSGKWNF